jgi:hypothetical protein
MLRMPTWQSVAMAVALTGAALPVAAQETTGAVVALVSSRTACPSGCAPARGHRAGLSFNAIRRRPRQLPALPVGATG